MYKYKIGDCVIFKSGNDNKIYIIVDYIKEADIIIAPYRNINRSNLLKDGYKYILGVLQNRHFSVSCKDDNFKEHEWDEYVISYSNTFAKEEEIVYCEDYNTLENAKEVQFRLRNIKEKYNEPYEGQEKFKFKIFDCVRIKNEPDSIYVVLSYLPENFKIDVKGYTLDWSKMCRLLNIKIDYNYAMVGTSKVVKQDDLILINDPIILNIVNQLEDYFKYLRYVRHK